MANSSQALFRWVPRWLWVSGGLLVAAGVVLFVVGVITADNPWWAANPYLTNVASSLTSALIGIPLSVVVISVVLDRARDQRVRARVYSTMSQAASAILELATDMIGSDLIGAARHEKTARRLACIQTIERYIEVRPGGTEPSQAVLDAVEKIRRHAPSAADYWDRAGAVRGLWSEIEQVHALASVNAITSINETVYGWLRRAVIGLWEDHPAQHSFDGDIDRARSAFELVRSATAVRNELEKLVGAPAQ